jgi:hypothetical protein
MPSSKSSFSDFPSLEAGKTSRILIGSSFKFADPSRISISSKDAEKIAVSKASMIERHEIHGKADLFQLVGKRSPHGDAEIGTTVFRVADNKTVIV